MIKNFITDFMRVLSEMMNPPKRYLHVDDKGNAKIITVKDGKIVKEQK